MAKDTTEGLEGARIANMDETEGNLEEFKRMYMDWLRFYRMNMKCLAGLCEWENPEACRIPEDCEEVDRVWSLWIETLTDDDKLSVI